MNAIQLPLSEQPHQNQQLFSDYYLNHILPLWRGVRGDRCLVVFIDE